MPVIPYAGSPVPRPDDERHETYRAEVRRQRRRRSVTVFAAVAMVFVLLVVPAMVWCVGLGLPNRAVEFPGPVQIIASSNEVWIFLDMERSVREPGAIAEAPRRRVIAQLAVVLNAEGVVKRTLIPAQPGDTFNHNLVDVFGLDDGLHLLESGRRISKWTDDRFVPLPAATPKTFSKVPGLAATPDYQKAPVLDRASRDHGWTPVLRENLWSSPLSFEWNGCRFVLEVDGTMSPDAVHLRRIDPGHEWSARIAEYDGTERRARPGE